MSFSKVFSHSVEAYARNAKLLSFFSLPFAILFPLSLALPNFVSLGGIFLRYGSIKQDLSIPETVLIIVAFLISLVLFSLALVAINLIIKSQRTLVRLSHFEKQKVEVQTFRLFTVFLLVFVLSLAANVFLYDYGLNVSYGLLFSLILSIAAIFTPQAVVIDDLGIMHSFKMSVSMVFRRLPYFLYFLAIASFLILLNGFVFLQLDAVLPFSRFIAVLVNALFILPFLEVLKVQIYLSKYTIL